MICKSYIRQIEDSLSAESADRQEARERAERIANHVYEYPQVDEIVFAAQGLAMLQGPPMEGISF